MKCLKCQNDTFDKNTILAKALDSESKYNPKECKFEILTCKKCYLTQWYDHGVISNGTKYEKQHIKTQYGSQDLPKFQCLNCESILSKNKMIEPFTGDSNCLEGVIFVRLCAKCGLVELYQVLLVFSTGKGARGQSTSLKQRAELARSFKCPVCASKKVDQTGQIAFISSEPQPAYLARPVMYSILAVCDQCKYMMVFKYF